MYNRGPNNTIDCFAGCAGYRTFRCHSYWGNMPEFAITLARWAAWAPGLDSTEDWACGNGQSADSKPGPALDWLPPMQRRRLPVLARGAFHVARRAAGEWAGDAPIVLASRHGEPSRTLGLLGALADGEPLSPAAFSLSVHNAISGQLGIALGNQSPASSVALAGDGLSGALIEALCLKQPGKPVLVVIYEAPLPEPYQPYSRSEPIPWALALLLDDSGTRYQLRSTPGSGDLHPQGPRLARFLAREEQQLTLTGERTDWHWRRTHDH